MKVRIYTIPDCSYCVELKERLTKMDIKYEDVNVSEGENEKTFDTIMEISGAESVPCVTVGKHLLAPDVNFSTIKEASELIKYILENEEE